MNNDFEAFENSTNSFSFLLFQVPLEKKNNPSSPVFMGSPDGQNRRIPGILLNDYLPKLPTGNHSTFQWNVSTKYLEVG